MRMARTESRESRPVRRELFLFSVCLLVLFGFAPSVHATSKHRLGSEASAASNVTVDLVDGNQTGTVLPGTPQQAPPGSAVALRVRATVGQNENWRRTSYQVGNGPVVCVDTSDAGPGAATVFVNPARVATGPVANRHGGGVTMPEAVGPGSVTVRLYSDANACTGEIGDASGAFTIRQVATNPTLIPSCETHLVLVLDESGSINDAG